MKTSCTDLSCHLILALLLYQISLLNLITSEAADTSCNVSTDKILLNCGSSESVSFNGKNWTGDVDSEYMPYAYETTSTASTISNPSVPKVPYSTARIFHSPFTYSFPVTPGLKFIRFYFYSAPYSGFNPSKACFSVISSHHFTLLDNFCPSIIAVALNSPYFTEHFAVYTHYEDHNLNITFSPLPLVSNAFAFVNGIEIFSLPLNLYAPTGNLTLPFVGRKAPFFIDRDETSFEILYRAKVGDESVQDYGDTDIFGVWEDDSSYMFGPQHGVPIFTNKQIRVNYSCSYYFASEQLYHNARTMSSNDAFNLNYNLTWIFSVDSGFNYIVRLHFCEISLEVTEVNQRVFKVYINNQTAEDRMDIIALTGAPFVATYKDYVVMVPQANANKRDLWLALHPNTDSNPKYSDAILNGIEIIKLSDSNKNLAAHFQIDNRETAEKSPKKIIIGGVLGGLAGLFLVCFVAFWLRKRLKLKSPGANTVNHMNSHVVLPIKSSDQCRQFSLADIKSATDNFEEALVIGAGGFGKVYRGLIDGGATGVAVKRGNPKSHQGAREFRNEIELLSKFRHMHLVSLIGYCQEGGEMILVYEYMAHGTLCDHLYKSQNSPLEWKQRLKICIGAARGLHHLHTGAKYSIIHRDVKSANILLDDEWVAKVSDFGLSKVSPFTASRGHVSTQVKGTFGYLDPEYYRRRKLTEKSDVYSFGVVLFEVLCSRPAVKHVVVPEDEEDERLCLAQWAIHCHQTGSIDQMIDPCLTGEIAPACLMVFVDIAVKCLADKGSERPSMSDVLGNLEQALHLQEMHSPKRVLPSSLIAQQFPSVILQDEPETSNE